MKNQVWAIHFTDKIKDFHKLEFEWHEQPSREKAAGQIVQQHYAGQQQPEIIDIAYTDLTPNQTKIKYFGYELIDIKLADSVDA